MQTQPRLAEILGLADSIHMSNKQLLFKPAMFCGVGYVPLFWQQRRDEWELQGGQ